MVGPAKHRRLAEATAWSSTAFCADPVVSCPSCADISTPRPAGDELAARWPDRCALFGLCPPSHSSLANSFAIALNTGRCVFAALAIILAAVVTTA